VLWLFQQPDCPFDAFATAVSLARPRVGWWQGAPSSRALAWPWIRPRTYPCLTLIFGTGFLAVFGSRSRVQESTRKTFLDERMMR
jgi:hypothetical protein